MNGGPTPPQLPNRIWHAALTMLAAALAIYFAAQLIRAVLPVIVGVLVVAAVGCTAAVVHRRRGGW